jgi:AraC-like DNA-binding protein
MDKLVEKALAFIENADGNVLTVPEVADALKVNRRALERRFKAAECGTLLDAITEARLRKAARMLALSDKTIYDIAEECSFSTPSYLVSVFRRRFGVTTREFRQICRDCGGYDDEEVKRVGLKQWLTSRK